MIAADPTQPPPHALGPEKAVISVLMKYPERFDDAAFLTPEHFWIPAHSRLFTEVSKLHQAGRTVDLVGFVQDLLDRGEIDAMGGPGGIAEVYTYAPNDLHLAGHLRILRDKLARRKALALAAEVERLAYEAEAPQEIVEATSAPISEIHDIIAESRPETSTRAVLAECMEDFKALVEGRESAMGIETSLSEINRRFRGLHPGRTIIISGYPGGGKTTLAGQLAMDAALAGENTLICSLEMSGKDGRCWVTK